MKLGLLIFLLAFIIRFINLLFLDLDVDTYLIEDQKFYWEWSLKGAYLPWSQLSSMSLSERMPGSFWFFEFLQWLTNKNLFSTLTFQSLIDAFTCVVIFNCAGMINKKYQLFTGLFAACSPLMIVVSSQILSDTIFIFIFSCCLYFLLKFIYLKNSNYALFYSGLFLGISAFIRAATFPLLFIGLPIIYLAIRSHNYSNKKAITSLFIFFIISISPVSYRLFNNIYQHDTYALTTQSGSHASYWMVPGVLSVSKGLDREASINFVNKEIAKYGGLTGDNYKDSKHMLKVSKDIIYKESIFDVSYSWLRSSFLNIIISPILIDNRVRNMQHPSFANNGNIIKWITSLFEDKKTFLYATILFLSLLLSLFTGISLVVGFYIFANTHMYLSIISFLIIGYFCFITGPTISPKYCLPYVPILFYIQAISLDKLLSFIKKREHTNNHK